MSHELASERGLWGNDHNFQVIDNDFRTAGSCGDKVTGYFASSFDFDIGTEVDGRSEPKVFWFHRGDLVDGRLNFGGLLRLTTSEVRSFETTSIILVLRLALFVGCLGAGDRGGLKIQGEVGGQFFDHFLNESLFVHGFGLGLNGERDSGETCKAI